MRLILPIISLSLAACGGSGGGGSSPLYPVNNDTELRSYESGDRITYRLNLKGQEYPSEGGGKYSANGELRRTMQLSEINCEFDGATYTYPAMDIVNITTTDGQESLSRSTHIFDGGIYLARDGEDYAGSCGEAVAGELPEQLPQTLFVGRSWGYSATFTAAGANADYNFRRYEGDYFISGLEEVRVPAGRFEAYKVVYDEVSEYTNSEAGSGFAVQYTENATLWIHPDAGPVKAVINYTEKGILGITSDAGTLKVEATDISFENDLTPAE